MFFTEEVQISSPAIPHVTCGLIHLNLLAKTTTKLLLVGILFLRFLYNFEILLGLLYFPREVFEIMYEDLLYGYYSFTFKFSGKVLPVTLILLFFLMYVVHAYQAFFERRKQRIF